MKSRNVNALLMVLLGLLLGSSSGWAQERRDSAVTHNFRLLYRVDEIVVDPTYLDNTQSMATIDRYLADSPRIDSITIRAYASPEGNFARNSWLAEQRAIAAKEYVLKRLGPKAGNPKIILEPTPEHWQGLYEEAYKNYWRHDRERVLEIIADKNISDERKKWLLQQQNEGYTWKILIRKHMPELRVATWICVWVPPITIDPVEPAEHQAYALKEPELPEREGLTLVEPRKYVPALKTNLLYDAATALNAAVEFPIGKQFSIMVEDTFPWWNWGPYGNKFCLQNWEMGIEPRWWFRRTDFDKPLLGHFLGAYASSGKCDFQRDTDICFQTYYWSTGLTYGYSLGLGKKKKLHLEFEIGVGYAEADYQHYQPGPDYEDLYIDRNLAGTFRWFGPTKAKISLVLPIEIPLKTRIKKI